MASMKFEKNSAEWAIFGDFWALCQKYWIPEDNDRYWEEVVDETGKFYKKYKGVDDIFVRRIILAFVETLEAKYKAGIGYDNGRK